MGGLVSRMILNTQPDIATRTKLFFQIASPVEGSPKAYWTLNKYPELSPFIDKLYLAHHLRDPDRRARLVTSVQSFASVFQLLPPGHINVLVGPGSKTYPAVHQEAWPKQLHGQLALAESIQEYLDPPSGMKVRCVYTKQHPTASQFVVDQFWVIKARGQPTVGDQTVPASSASARSSDEIRVAVEGPLTEHTALCSNPKVHQLLREALL
jgi:hypothetical protein